MVPSLVLWLALGAIVVIAALLLVSRSRGAAVRVAALALILLNDDDPYAADQRLWLTQRIEATKRGTFAAAGDYEMASDEESILGRTESRKRSRAEHGSDGVLHPRRASRIHRRHFASKYQSKRRQPGTRPARP